MNQGGLHPVEKDEYASWQAFGRWLREQRKEAGVTQIALAHAIGVTGPYLSKIENGAVAPPSIHLMERISKFLNVSEEEVFIAALKIPYHEISRRAAKSVDLTKLLYWLATAHYDDDFIQLVLENLPAPSIGRAEGA